MVLSSLASASPTGAADGTWLPLHEAQNGDEAQLGSFGSVGSAGLDAEGCTAVNHQPFQEGDNGALLHCPAAARPFIAAYAAATQLLGPDTRSCPPSRPTTRPQELRGSEFATPEEDRSKTESGDSSYKASFVEHPWEQLCRQRAPELLPREEPASISEESGLPSYPRMVLLRVYMALAKAKVLEERPPVEFVLLRPRPKPPPHPPPSWNRNWTPPPWKRGPQALGDHPGGGAVANKRHKSGTYRWPMAGMASEAVHLTQHMSDSLPPPPPPPPPPAAAVQESAPQPLQQLQQEQPFGKQKIAFQQQQHGQPEAVRPVDGGQSAPGIEMKAELSIYDFFHPNGDEDSQVVVL